MSDVNTNTIPVTLPPKRFQGKKKLPVDRRRVILSVRVLPSTKDYLEKMGYSTAGRALDLLVKAVQHKGISRMIDAGSDITIVNLVS